MCNPDTLIFWGGFFWRKGTVQQDVLNYVYSGLAAIIYILFYKLNRTKYGNENILKIQDNNN